MEETRNTLNTRELQDSVNEYQTGEAKFTPEIPMHGMEQAETLDTAVQTPPDLSKSLYNTTRASLRTNAPVAIDDTASALAQGFGTSKYDSNYYEGKDLEQSRAIEESDFAKITAGLTKGGVTALTTAANTTIGTIYGIGSGLFELAFDTNNNGRSFLDTVDAGVNNTVSQKLIDIQNWSEKAFPNYRTQEERTEKWQQDWWKPSHWNANFVGDSILKNFGFTLGAIPGGVFWSKLIGMGMSRKFAGDIMKGVAMGSEGDAAVTAEMTRVTEGLKKGTISMVDAQKLVQNMSNVAKQLNKAETRLQLYGSAFSAMGEGSSEGIMAHNEFLEDFEPQIDAAYKEEYDKVERDILQSGDRNYVSEIPKYNADGTIDKAYVLTPFGLATLATKRMEVNEKYKKIREDAKEQAKRLASTTWLLNLPILTASNQIQFARIYSGGWKTNRLNSINNKGGIHINGNKITSDYAKSGSVLGKALGNSLKVALSEGNEEMLQGVASSGAKQVARYRLLSEFNNDGYDEDAINSARTWYEQMFRGGADYLEDIKNWQEGALGAFTGLFGIPGKHWHGGIAEAVKDAKSEVRASQQAAENLNKYIRSDDFQNRWHDYIRHAKYDNDMAKATAADDEYAWHTADSKQLIGDVIAFANEGKLQDLIDFAQEYGSITDEQAQAIKNELTNSKEPANQADPNGMSNMSLSDIKERVKKQATRLADAAKEYGDLYSAMRVRLPANASPDFLKEIVATAMEIKEYDRRFLSMLNETLQAIDPILSVIASVDSEGNAVTDIDEQRERFQSLRDNYERIFAGSLVPLNTFKQIKIETALQALTDMARQTDPETAKKIEDMQKLSKARQEYYEKLQTLQEPEAEEKFQEQQLTQEKLEEMAQQETLSEEVKVYDTLDKIKQEYWSRDAIGKGKFITMLQQAGNKSAAVKTFLKLNDTFRRFNEFLVNSRKYMSDPNDVSVIPNMIASLCKDAAQKAKSKKEFLSMADNLFESKQEFDTAFAGIFGATSPTAYESAKRRLREAALEFSQNEGVEQTRQELKKLLEQEKAEEEKAKREGKPIHKEHTSGAFVFIEPSNRMSVPEGYDASAPASMGEQPSEWLERKKKEEEEKKKAEKAEKEKDLFVDVHITTPGGSREAKFSIFTVKQDEKGIYHLRMRDDTYRCNIPISDYEESRDELLDALFGENVPAEVNDDTIIKIGDIDVFPDGHTEAQITLSNADDGKSGSWNMSLHNVNDLNHFLQIVASQIADRFQLQSKYEIESDRRDKLNEAINGEPIAEATPDDQMDTENDIVSPNNSTAEKAEQEKAPETTGGKLKSIYYRTSVPEKDSWEAAKARAAMTVEERKQADLSDFVKLHPEYATVWNALADRNAFKYTDTEVKVGDKIEFMIDPTFPMYNNEPQILVVKKLEDGSYQTLNTLSYQTDSYYGLKELRNEIMSDYNKFKETHPNEKFVFGKSSIVWTVRDGLIDYNYDESGNGEHSINELEGYENGSILYIDREDKVTTVWGTASAAGEKAVNTLKEKLKARANSKSEEKNKRIKYGRLFYYRTFPNGKSIIVALKQQHFNKKTMNKDNGTFQAIRDSISRLTQIIKKGTEIKDGISYYKYQDILDTWNSVKEKYLNDPTLLSVIFGQKYTAEQNAKQVANITSLFEKAAKQYAENPEQELDKSILDAFEYLVVPQKKEEKTKDESIKDEDDDKKKTEETKQEETKSESRIPELTQFGIKIVPVAEQISAINREMHEELATLKDYLDYHKWFFDFSDIKNVGFGVRINNGETSIVRRSNQITEEWLMDFFTSQDFTIAVTQKDLLTDANAKIQEDKFKTMNRLVSDGVITANVNSLRQTGVDFYYNAYNPKTGKFEPMSETQEQLLNERNDDYENRLADEDAMNTEERLTAEYFSNIPSLDEVEFGRKPDTEAIDESNPAQEVSEAEAEEKSKSEASEATKQTEQSEGKQLNTPDAESFDQKEKATPSTVELGGQEYHIYTDKELEAFANMEWQALPADVKDAMEHKGFDEQSWNSRYNADDNVVAVDTVDTDVDVEEDEDNEDHVDFEDIEYIEDIEDESIEDLKDIEHRAPWNDADDEFLDENLRCM